MTLAPRDHNAPSPPVPLTPAEITDWLDYQGAALVSRRDELLAGLTAMLAAVPLIETNEQLGDFAENKSLVSTLKKTGEAQRTAAKAPFLDGGRAVDGWFAKLMEPLAQPLATVQSAMDAYGRKLREAEEKRRIEFARAAQAEADRLAREATALQAAQDAAAASKRPVWTDPEEDERARVAAEEAAASAAKAQAAIEAKAADMTRVVGSFGYVTSMRTSWHPRVVDLSKVPVEYIEVNMAAVKAAMKIAPKATNGRPLLVIEGIVFDSTETMR